MKEACNPKDQVNELREVKEIRNLRQPSFICIDSVGNIFITEVGVAGASQFSSFGHHRMRYTPIRI